MSVAANTGNGAPLYGTIKRAADMFVSGILLVVLSPLMIGLSLAVLASSPGPVFFRGVRTGLNGVPFEILKYRSMKVGSEHGAGTTSRNDHRVTAVGRTLRRYKLDELPQLFNVLVGDMSFVGPRPELPRYTQDYRGEELIILSVRPGITDLASIRFSDLGSLIDDNDPDGSFERNVLPQKNRLRVEYAKNIGLLLDLKILLKTVALVLARPFGRTNK